MRITRKTSRPTGGLTAYAPDSLPAYRGGSGGSSFDPASIVGAGDTALILDYTDNTTTYQDVLKTTVADMAGDPVRAIAPQPHDGIQCPDMLYLSGTYYTLVEGGVATGSSASETSCRLSTAGVDFNHDNGVTCVVGVKPKNVSTFCEYINLYNNRSGGYVGRQSGLLKHRYTQAPLIQTEAMSHEDLHAVRYQGSSTQGGTYLNGILIGGLQAVSGSENVNIYSAFNADRMTRVFLINRDLTVEEALQVDAWVVS